MADNGTTDRIKGRVKEAAGALTDDEELKREGQTDKAAGKIKDSVNDAVDRVREFVSGDDDK